MLKFIWGKGTQPLNPERAKLQKELFAFQKTIHHGFPHKPTSLAWDPELRLFAIGTRKGDLRIYGRPGVEFYGCHASESPVTKLLFLPGQGRVVALTDDNVLHLWEINGTNLSKKKVGLEGRLKRISCLELDSKKRILVGTEGGNIYMVNLRRFNFDEHIIYQDIVIASCNNKEDFKLNPGAVESILMDPSSSDKILIGYERGLIVLWDRATASAEQSFVANQQLESLVWRNDGSEFISAHNDGSYIVWSKSKGSGEPPSMPYGPYPCKAISQIQWFHANGTPWMIFSGGMPRASYGDKYTVSVFKGDGEKHVVFDLSSKIVDFTVLTSGEDNSQPCSLFILAEEELVGIDLLSPEFKVLKAPYLNSIHSSAVTCIHQVSDVSQAVYSRLEEESSGGITEWPISGGNHSPSTHEKGRDVLLTGHEDGSVKLWSAGGISLHPLAVLSTAKYFSTDDEAGNDEEKSSEDKEGEPDEEDDEEDESWPPFRKVGSFDPYSDDPRMAIKKVAMCRDTGRVFIGGTAGQVVIFDLFEEDSGLKPKVLSADLVTEKEGFTWKGHSGLSFNTQEAGKRSQISCPTTYQLSSVLQINPPASINSLGFHGTWGIMAVGTAHGLVFLDCISQDIITSKCTLNAQDIANADDNPMSRRKSLKKSLRESFRRLRKGRSQRQADKKKIGAAEPIRRDLRSDSPESRPIERQVEARSGSDDGLGSMVRCLHFANTYIASGSTLSPTVWAGTNSGQILIFMLTVPARRNEDGPSVSSILAKEIQLKHRAPVIDIQVLDSSGLPVRDGSQDSPHRVLIASEEQFKIFLLPTLKPCGKYKLTAHEGSRIRKVGFTSFISKSDETLKENCFVCLTNLGDIAVHSLPELRRQTQTPCIKKEDVIAISTLVFTSNGEAFYLSSSSEIQRVSVAAARVMLPNGTVSLSPHARMEAPASPPIPASVNKSNDTNGPPGDAHNETTVSEVSADITLDSVKDHTVIINETTTSRGQEVKHQQLSPPPLHNNNNKKPSEVPNGELESTVNGVLSDNLDNSVVIEDHLSSSNQNETHSKLEKGPAVEVGGD